MKTILWCTTATIAFALLLHALIPEQVPAGDVAKTAAVSGSAPVDTSKSIQEASPALELPVFTEESLARYDGSDPTLPIYIGFDGFVYDVTGGREFYEPGAAYDFLAGTDGTTLLKIAGGGIIREKYPVVGTFAE